MYNGFRNAGLGETQVGRGSAKPGSASGETGGGTKLSSDREVLRRLVERAEYSVVQHRQNCADLASTVFKTYLDTSWKTLADAMAEAESALPHWAGAIMNKPEAEQQTLKSNSVSCVYVWVAFEQPGLDKMGAEHVAVLRRTARTAC